MEPFGFFTFDALRAGWYLVWRQFVRAFPLMMGAVLIGWFLMSRVSAALGGFLMAIGLIVGAVWAAMLIPRFTSEWSEKHYGFPLTAGASVWWNVSWRATVASIIASIVLTPPQMVATSLTATFKGSALGGLGSLLTALLGLANFGVTLLATGWAMSRVALAQSGDFFDQVPATLSPLGPMVSEPALEPAMAAVSDPIVPSAEPHAAVAHAPMPERAPMLERAAVAAPVAAPAMAARPAPAAVASASHEGKRQCPKCSLYETELGKVIGWYCRICGWRESRR
jgi:hypothetical protein